MVLMKTSRSHFKMLQRMLPPKILSKRNPEIVALRLSKSTRKVLFHLQENLLNLRERLILVKQSLNLV